MDGTPTQHNNKLQKVWCKYERFDERINKTARAMYPFLFSYPSMKMIRRGRHLSEKDTNSKFWPKGGVHF